MANVFLGLPCYGLKAASSHTMIVPYASEKGYLRGMLPLSYSILTRNFNHLLCEALNRRPEITHFAMLHDDIEPEKGWLDKMVDLMEETKCDVLSAVSPIKDGRGQTSTALDIPSLDSGEWGKYTVKKLTLKEIKENFPPTFTDDKLLVNTGLMLIDIRKPWVEKIWFEFQDRIIFFQGKYQPVSLSEDWGFSRRARELGARIYATREVALIHYGTHGYSNQ